MFSGSYGGYWLNDGVLDNDPVYGWLYIDSEVSEECAASISSTIYPKDGDITFLWNRIHALCHEKKAII
jgi:hypothetical protein